MSTLFAILISSTSESKDSIGTEECLCRDKLFFCAPEAVRTAKWEKKFPGRRTVLFPIVAISVDEAHSVSER